MQQLIHKSFTSEQEALPVNDAALSLVRKHAQRDIAAEEVFLGRMCLSATGPDSDHECFTRPQLERFRDTIIGASLLEGHDYKKRPLGRFYDASVEPAGNEHRLMASFYINRKNEQLVSDIELGIQKHSSIGAWVADAFICNLCNLDYSGAKSEAGQQCIHQAGKKFDGQLCTVTRAGDLEDYRAVEGSFVFLGAHPEAILTTMSAVRVAKTALLQALAQQSPRQGGVMELQQALQRIEELEAQLKQATGDASLVEAGKAYRAHLESEVVRLAGVVGAGAPEMYADHLLLVKDAGLDALKRVHARVTKEFEAKYPPTPVGRLGDAGSGEPPPPREFDPSRRMRIPAVGGS